MEEIKNYCLDKILEIRKKIRKENDDNLLYELAVRLDELIADYFD